MQRPWIEFLEQNAANFKDKIAIIDQGSKRRITYDELNKEVNRWAHFLATEGVGRNDGITFLSTNRLEHLTLLLACAKLGAFLVPLNFRLASRELEEIVRQIRPKLCLEAGQNSLDVDFKHIDIRTLDLSHYSDQGLNPKNYSIDETILVLFTSGSTGVPKGVMFHGEMLFTNQLETCRNWGLKSSDITLVETPFFHTGGYNVLLLPLLYLGGTSILAPRFEPDNVFRMIEEEKVTVYFSVPTMFQMLLDHDRCKRADFSSIRFFISGGAACSVSLILDYQKMGIMFKQGFGLTEVGPNCFLLDEKFALSKAGSFGVPMPHSKVMVVDLEGKEVGVDTPGELLIGGPHVCLGYYQNREAFEGAFRGGFFHTGDLVKYDKDGFFYFVGRIKDMYVSGGENVYPGEVEKQLLCHPDIDEAVVVSVPDEKWGEVGFAFLKTRENITVLEVRMFLNERLSRYKHPHYVKCEETLPLLPNGKVNRKELKAEAQLLFNEQIIEFLQKTKKSDVGLSLTEA